MRLSKRDFLKSLGFGAAGTALATAARPLPAEPGLMDNPVIARPPVTNAHGSQYEYLNYLEAVDAILYDRVSFRPGETLPGFMRLFMTPCGTTCPYTGAVKLYSRTNMDLASTLPAPSSFWVKRIHIAVNPDIAPADLKTAREFSWGFWIGLKRLAGGPFATDMERTTLATLLKGKTPAVRSSLEFPHAKGIFIPSRCHFWADITTYQPLHNNLGDPATFKLSADGNGIEFCITLEGVRWWAVQ
jgi:hypothetical protein